MPRTSKPTTKPPPAKKTTRKPHRQPSLETRLAAGTLPAVFAGVEEVIEHVEKRHRELVDKIEQPKQPRDGKDPQPRPEPQQRDAE